MPRYVFFILTILLSIVYSAILNKGLPTDIISIGGFTGTAFGAFVWIGLFPYGITRIGKNKNIPKRNLIAFCISVFLFLSLAYYDIKIRPAEQQSISSFQNVQQGNVAKIPEDAADILAEYLETHNALYALLMQKNPSFRTEMKQVIKGINPNSPLLRKWNETHSFDVVDLEAIPSVMNLLEKEFSKYMRFASDQDIYDMYQTEYNHMVKNNCQVFPIPEADRQETIRVKSKLVNNSINNPYKGEVMSEEEAAKAFKQIGAYYGKKGYGIADLMIVLDGGKNLSRTEQCRAVKQFYEAILSLPKATSGKLVRTISQ